MGLRMGAGFSVAGLILLVTIEGTVAHADEA